MSLYIIKASGEREQFNIEKFRRSLLKAGADEQLINRIAHELEQRSDLRTTHDIYRFALNHLRKQYPSVAARYNIKKALFELGPAGFSFEQFIGEIFKNQGYSVQEDVIAHGFCVDHELDVIAIKDTKHVMVECKFHNQQGIKSDVKIPLYVKARFDDIQKGSAHGNEPKRTFHSVWLATNTNFTTQAIEYANCTSIELLSWSYPAKGNLPDLIDTLGLQPITTLVSLNHHQKTTLIKHGLVLCRDMPKYVHLLQQFGLNQEQISELLHEAQKVYQH